MFRIESGGGDFANAKKTSLTILKEAESVINSAVLA